MSGAALELAPEVRAELVARAVRGGYAPADAERRLLELLRIHSGVNLAVGLAYWGYATERRAAEVAGVTL